MRELSPVMPVDVPENHVTHCITTYNYYLRTHYVVLLHSRTTYQLFGVFADKPRQHRV